MEIKNRIVSQGVTYDVVYRDEDPASNLGDTIIHGVHAICFCEEKMVIVCNLNGEWTPPGGSLEPGENYQQACVREVQEESNMKVLYKQFIGYQDVWFEQEKKMSRQARMFCMVGPYGDFISDPDNDITEIKLIDPKDYKQYFDWGLIGDEVVRRALEMKAEYDKNYII